MAEPSLYQRLIGGLLGEDLSKMDEEERKRLTGQATSRAVQGLLMGEGLLGGLGGYRRERQAEELRRQRQAKQRAQESQLNQVLRAGGQMTQAVLEGRQPLTAAETMPDASGLALMRGPRDLSRLAGTLEGQQALLANPELREAVLGMAPESGMQVVGGSIYDRATGQFITPPKEQQPRTPVREIRRGNVVDVYFNDGTMETRPIGVAPTTGGPSGSGVVTLPDVGTVKLTAGDLQRDKDFAKGWTEFSARGGFADTVKQLGQLQEVLRRLQSGEDLTGPFTGFLMSNAPALAAAYQEGAVSAKDAVEEVVQRNLRLILGAQFTEKEGERLIARAYNPALKEEENARRLQRLIQQMLSAASATQQAGQYFDQFGTLKGYNAKLPSFADFDITGKGEQAMAEDVPEGIDPLDWQYMTPEQRKLWQK